MNPASKIQEGTVDIDDLNIHYIKTGSGEHIVLFMPSVLESCEHFVFQLELLDDKKYTLISWDAPGYGKSRPPDRTFPDNYLERDACWAYRMMKALGYEKFSLVGICDGATTGLLLAARYPETIRKLVLIDSRVFMEQKHLDRAEAVRDVDKWSEERKRRTLPIYGKDYSQKVWSECVDTMKRTFITRQGDICKDSLAKIKCPTLIIYESGFCVEDMDQQSYIKQHIENSQLQVVESQAFDIHLKHYKELNEILSEFLSGNS
ncbi:valacyclovir hydrolase-like isoform X2 [Prorops nasuta]|uniref:valacyclovir hydrolase-like isoform X2 n=1 Tax=Prorops nasuta TaxID=863751 RepID=UPI0034CEAE6C